MTQTTANGTKIRRTVEAAGRTGKTTMDSRRDARIVTMIGRQIDKLYLQLDAHLTSMARLQLEVDELRSKLKRL